MFDVFVYLIDRIASMGHGCLDVSEHRREDSVSVLHSGGDRAEIYR
jgi:hypothetical protein